MKTDDTLTLGQQLALNKQAAHDRDAAKNVREKAERDAQAVRIRNIRSRILSNAYEKIAESIKQGKTFAGYKISDYDDQKWIKTVSSKTRVPNYAKDDDDLWEDFVSKLSNDGLLIRVADEHDGMGMHSWIRLVAEPR